MFIGDLVKLKPDVIRVESYKTMKFIENAKKEDWIWLVTGIDDEDLDYIIRPIYLYSECSNITQLSGVSIHDEIEKTEMSREELFKNYIQITEQYVYYVSEGENDMDGYIRVNTDDKGKIIDIWDEW